MPYEELYYEKWQWADSPKRFPDYCRMKLPLETRFLKAHIAGGSSHAWDVPLEQLGQSSSFEWMLHDMSEAPSPSPSFSLPPAVSSDSPGPFSLSHLELPSEQKERHDAAGGFMICERDDVAGHMVCHS
eukprot:gnl/TRDRNA2_/TRDRNA2_134464_c1_seq1.p1 gnl/TRDRNA2_/TRDRNA2_134464_c1~~gnl/TRDRNA2_/TRDRNA2_134464_c1_seq1.p1  ORF type:complete len:150 (-),score=22.08 gnl/TRDRNA2_/TRDRNA2_134464_c1_seq1:145-531(-)